MVDNFFGYMRRYCIQRKMGTKHIVLGTCVLVQLLRLLETNVGLFSFLSVNDASLDQNNQVDSNSPLQEFEATENHTALHLVDNNGTEQQSIRHGLRIASAAEQYNTNQATALAMMPSNNSTNNTTVTKANTKNNATNNNNTALHMVDGAERKSIRQEPISSAEHKISNNLTNNTTAANNTNNATNTTTHLIIHVGPVKTGSTSIQCNLQVNPYMKDSSYEFLGKQDDSCAKPHPPLIRPSHHVKGSQNFMNIQMMVYQYILRGWLPQDQFKDYVQDFQQGMEYRHKHGINSIISAEEFCGMLEAHDDRWQEFADFINGIPQEVRFQVSYRDYFDWVVSQYSFYQLFDFWRPSFSKKSLSSIVDHTMHDCPPHKIWSLFRSKLPAFHRGHSVDVLNMHGSKGDKEDMVTRFICSLPNAEAACEGSKKLKLGKARPTDTDRLHADRIATAAWKQGMFFNSSAVQNRRERVNKVIRNHVKNHLNTTFLELPQECLKEKQLNELWNKSVRHGRAMLGDDEFNEDAMRVKFDSFVAKKKFCSVNVAETLKDPAWKVFFKNETLFR